MRDGSHGGEESEIDCGGVHAHSLAHACPRAPTARNLRRRNGRRFTPTSSPPRGAYMSLHASARLGREGRLGGEDRVDFSI